MASEGVLEDVDLGTAVRAKEDAGNIETVASGGGSSPCAHEGLGYGSDLTLLGPVHRIVGEAAPRRRPGLHLTERHEPVAGDDEIELPEPAPPVPGHEVISAAAVLMPGGLLALPPQLVPP